MTEYIIPEPGPHGPPGDRGPEGLQGLQGPPGDQGIQGVTGTAFTMLGSVPTYNALPVSANLPGFAYHVVDSGKIYIWSGNSWLDAGRWRGFTGSPGTPGLPGLPGTPGTDGRPGVPGDATDISDWVNSKGVDNLITNGTGYLRNLTNFSQFQNFITRDPPPNSTGTFTCEILEGNVTTDELVPLVLGQEYVFWFYIKQRDSTVPRGTFKGGIAAFDADGFPIHSIHYAHLPNTTTTLARDLTPGDWIIHLTDSSNWHNGDDPTKRALIFWDYVNAQGESFDPHTYSRHVSDTDAWEAGAIDSEAHTIMLPGPWSYGVLEEGTSVSNAISGSLDVYGIEGEATLEWTHHIKRFTYQIPPASTGGVGREVITLTDGLPPGTVTIKPAWSLNNDTVEGSIHSVGGVLLSTTVALGFATKETLDAVYGLQENLDNAQTIIDEAQEDLNEVKTDLEQAKTDAAQAKADALAAFGQSSQAAQDAEDAWNKAVEAEEAVSDAKKQGGVVKLDSSRGLLFKHNAISTELTVTVYKGDTTITDILSLRDEYGPGAYLEWFYQLMGETTWGVISSADARLSQGGFKMTISPAEVDEKTNFKVVVHGD